jgi:hypothetical protein
MSVRFGGAPSGMFTTVVPLIPIHTSRLIAVLPWTRFSPCWLAECDPRVLNAHLENIQTSRGHITIDIEGRKHGEEIVLIR